MPEKQKKKKTEYQATYNVYQGSNEDTSEDTRNTKELTDDEYYKLYEDDRMIFKEK